MIRLVKGPKPDVLRRNAKRWTDELLDALQRGDAKEIRNKKSRYNHGEIKTALRYETHDKCAYCEAFVTAVAHGDIEHITAKSLKPKLTFDWDNLTFACQICNQRKATSEDVLDPYEEEPGNHIFFFGHIARGKTGDGTITISEIDLNRGALIESRQRELKRFSEAFERILQESNENVREALIKNIEDDITLESTPYSKMLSDTWSAYKNTIPN